MEEKKMKKYSVLFAGVLLASSVSAFAATSAANAATVSPTLQISATIQKAVALTLATGATAGISHCAVAAGGGPPDYTMSFGTVDALGINAGGCNVVKPTSPGNAGAGMAGDAIYWTDYTVTPIFTSHQTFTGTTVSAQVTTDFAAPHNVFIVRSATATSSTTPAVSTDFAALNTTAADVISAAGTVSGTALTRFVGVAVTPTNATNVLQGAQTATVTFTLTVQ
jgi:hypothetical protein